MPAAKQEFVVAGKAHRVALNEFECATPKALLYTPGRGKHHPRRWELDVQTHLRTIHPPSLDSEGILLGFDEDKLSSACHFGFNDEGNQFLIWAIATSVEHRRIGYGKQTLDLTMDVIKLNRDLLEMDCGVFTRIHPSNEGSKALFQQAGFEFLGADPAHPDLETWMFDFQAKE